ncbi:MAG TPA: Uma2 family endonuclease [Pyrinomonadaceae bacterium]|nr:Uma2 family endonuclease [Pyrinomonadaceae bacterium]
MSTATQLVTAEQFLHMPKQETFRCELVEGMIIRMSPAGIEHGMISVNIAFLLAQHVKANKLGIVLAAETGYKLAGDPDTVLAPDASFIRQQEFERIGATKKFWPGAPDLAVEVMSPDDTIRKTDEKARAWLAHGARMVWVVNPNRRTLSVYRPDADVLVLAEDDELGGGNVVPGFRCDLREIFS